MERKRFFFMSTTNTIKIEDLIDSFDVSIPSKEKFLQLSNICPIDPIKPENNSNLEYMSEINNLSLIHISEPTRHLYI